MTTKIDEQFEHDLGVAKQLLLDDGYLVHTMIGSTIEGKVIYFPLSFSDDEEKERALVACRLIFVHFGVIRYTSISEVWMSKAEDGEIKGRPSEDPNRREGIMAVMVSHDGMKGRVLETIRDDSGEIVDLSPLQDMDGARMGGRFTELLPPIRMVENPHVRETSLKLLREIGMTIEEVKTYLH